MNYSFVGIALVSFLGVSCHGTPDAHRSPEMLWAGISVSSPLVEQPMRSTFMLHFALLNEGNDPIVPEVKSWKLLVNGTELNDSAWIFANGPTSPMGTQLRPGESMLFGKGLCDYITKPGLYSVVWKGTGFESAPIVFRVQP